MKVKSILLFGLALSSFLLMSETGSGQTVTVPSYFTLDNTLSDSLSAIVKAVGLDSTYDCGADGMQKISLAVVDLNSDKPLFGGVNYGEFIYPASVYKMYVAMEVLKEISDGDYFLTTPYIVRFPNAVDQTREIAWDPRPILQAGDTVSIGYLLDLMITRSDNSAANCMIDVATRDSINKTIDGYGWYGSEVTRKFLSREYEDSAYKNIRGTNTCALHAADFMYRVYTNRLVNPWVSMEMKNLLGMQLDTTKLSRGLPTNTMFYHKTGWWGFWTNDVGIVDNGKVKYVISLFTPVLESNIGPRFEELSRRIYHLIERGDGL